MGSESFLQSCADLGVPLSPEQFETLARFEERLYAANEVMNLTRVAREDCWVRHFLDSLLFQDLVPAGSTVLDIGCGPGFPSFPFAVARPDLKITALDSSGKMTRFLEPLASANLTVVCARAEEWGRRDEFDAVTGRALAPLPIQLELSAPALKVGGRLVAMRTPNEREMCEAKLDPRLGLQLDSIHERDLPHSDIRRLFPVFIKARETARSLPRTWAEMKRKPL